MLVELFALPGSGKTTVASAAAQRARVVTRKDLSAAWAEISALQRAVHIGRAFANPTVLKAASRFAFGARIATLESIFRSVRLLAKRDWLRSQPGVILLDQGFLQDLWSILMAGNSNHADPQSLSPLVRALYEDIDVTIVVLDVEPTTAATRLQSRTSGHSRFEHLPKGELRSSLVTANDLQSIIIEAAKEAGLDVRTIDGSREQEAVTADLLSLLPKQSPLLPARSEQPPRRISIVGPSGSGKSYLARQLAERLELPVHELDELRRSTSSTNLPRESFQNRVAELTRGDEWIIDGHYRDVRHGIWSRAELVVWLNYPLSVVGRRLYGRFRRKLKPGQSDGGAQPQPHKPASWASRLGRLARTLRERGEYGSLLRSPEYPNLKIVELKSISETERWLRNL